KSMQPEPDISVCIVTYRRRGSLVRLLRSLDRQEGARPSPAPFDPRLAFAGGADVEMFERMIRGGAKLISIAAPVNQNRRSAVWAIGFIYPEYARPS
ncbi:MAG TPA: hypothetical protein VN821_14375, partial [Candidatus Udaeobacter sp.]|nr:hypothetical protein [Candidatus Udaeobacter sp.]